MAKKKVIKKKKNIQKKGDVWDQIYADIFKYSPSGAYTINHDGLIDSFNPSMVEMAGAALPDEILGLNALTLPTYKEVGLDKFFKKGLQGEAFETEVEYTSFTAGKKTYRHYKGIPILSADGKNVAHLLLLVEDITERKLAEEAVDKYHDSLRVEKEKLDIILQSIGDAVFVIDENREIMLVNKMLEKLSGYKRKEMIGSRYEEYLKFIYEEDGSENKEFIKSVFEQGEIVHLYSRNLLIQKNGNKLDVADSAAPIKNEHGKVIGCVVVFRDATKEHQIDKMKSEFISIVSHQLRTPLTGVKWFAELLLKGKAGDLNEKQEKFVSQIFNSNNRMIDLVDDLLNVSRIETGHRFVLKRKKQDIIKIIHDAVDDLSFISEKNHVKVIYAKSMPNNFKISVDADKIRQVFHNLVDNAIKYSGSGGKVVINMTERNSNEVVFSIGDTGIGIPEDQHDRVFQKFFRTEDAKISSTDGTGLGLYIGAAIVKAHGGNIWYSSKEGKGTTMFFSLHKKPATKKNKKTTKKKS